MTKLLPTVQVSACESSSQVSSSKVVEVVVAAKQCMKDDVRLVVPMSDVVASVVFVMLMLI